MITFEHIQAFFVVVIGVCAFIGGIAGLATAVTRYWKFAHKQSDENAEDLKEVMEYLRNDKAAINELRENQAEFREQNKLMLMSLMHITAHIVEGNHTAQLKQDRDNIQAHLFERL